MKSNCTLVHDALIDEWDKQREDAKAEIASLRDRLAKAERAHDELMSKYADTQAWCLQWRDDKAKAEASLALAVAELHNIANSRPHEWPEETRNQFQPWAQSRARHAIAAVAANPLPEAP